MLGVKRITIIVGTLFLACQVNSSEFKADFHDVDVFQATKVNYYNIMGSSVIEQINNLLVDRTKSTDPKDNFDILLDELIKDQKNNVGPSNKSTQVKRLILALSTLDGKNECGYYGYTIIRNLYFALGSPMRSITRDENLRRVDKILQYYIREHVENCEPVYLSKFHEISGGLDSTIIEHLNTIVAKSIQDLTGENSYYRRSSYPGTLYNLATEGLLVAFEMKPEHIYDALTVLAKDDPDEKYLRRIEDERTGHPKFVKDKIESLFKEYIAKPCNYFRQKFGPDVFMPAAFDNIFKQRMKPERVDFYEAWVKYRLCHLKGNSISAFDDLLRYLYQDFKPSLNIS